MLLSRVSDYITQHNLLCKSRLHLVALSGGADSVCLLLMLKELGYVVHAVHCNFHLRGEESNRDENFCVELCKKQGIELHLTHFDTLTYAQSRKISIEMAARELRYNFFEQLRQSIDAEHIAVAHHRDDNVETFLINLLRGTGIHGLQAIKPRNGRIVRPLLCINRSEIEDFLALRRQEYVTDSTNLVDDVVRNKVRLNLLPLLESINPAVRDNISRTISHVSESVKIVDCAVEESISEVTTGSGMLLIDKEKLLKQPSPEHVLYTILSRYGFSPAQAEQVFANVSAPSGRSWSAEDYEIATDRDALVIAPREEYSQPLQVPEPGTYIYNVHARKGGVHIRISLTIADKSEGFTPSKESHCVTLDADKVRFPLIVRRVGEGDRFAPFGMRGTKLVSDYLTDRKRNLFQRRRQLVVEDADGRIVWLVGERAAQQAACGCNTIKILTLRYSINEE